jgi:hypothetical protein
MDVDRVDVKASIIIGIIGVILISFIYFRPVSIERDYSGYMYAGDSEFQKSTEIKLVGTLKKKLTLNHVFKGTIEVDGIKQEIILKRIWAKNNIFNSEGYSAFIENKSSTDNYEVTGTLDTSKDFNQIVVRLYEIDNKYNGKFNICGPSSNIKEAEGILANMEKDNK